MSRRESRESQSKRLHHKLDREPSPKRSRRDGKPATERTSTSNHNLEIVDPTDRNQKHRRRLQDAIPLEAPLASESKTGPVVADKGSEKKNDGLLDSTRHPLDLTEIPRSRSYFQHDERGSAGQGGRSSIRRDTDRGRWSDSKDRSSDQAGDKLVAHDVQKRDEKTHTQADDKNVWHHDGFFELETEAPPARKRPAFREKKVPPENAVGATETESVKSTRLDRPMFSRERREERRSNHPHGLDKPERPIGADERNVKTGDRTLHRGEVLRAGTLRERFGSGSGLRGRDRFNGRYVERNQHRPTGFHVDKWKHDLFDEANRSPPPKNEEDQIAKVEALLAL